MSRWPGRLITKTPVTPGGSSPTASAPGVWTLPEMAYWKKQGLWPDASADAYWGYVSYLMATSSLSNANNNLFVDSSGAFSPVSRVGNTTQGSVTPYGTLWSVYLDGSGDYLTAPTNAAYDISGGDYTIEAWVNFSALPAANNSGNRVAGVGIYSSGFGGGWEVALDLTQNLVSIGQPGSASLTSASYTFAIGQWYHVAVCRASGTNRIFVNGTSLALTANTFPNNATGSAQLRVGAGLFSGGYEHYLPGYISNFRLVKGTGLYSSNFTPSTSPLTAVSGTSILTAQSNRFRDNSTNNATVSGIGDARVTPFSPFVLNAPGISYSQSDISYWSGYFDGSGDYLTIPSDAAFGYGTGDFTIEFWMYLTGTPDQTIISNLTSASSTNPHIYYSAGTIRFYTASADRITSGSIVVGQWYHVALTRASGSTKMFVNGVQAGSTYADSNNYGTTAPLGIATYWSGGSPVATNTFTGYVSNARVVKGTAVYTSNFTPPTAPLTAISGTSVLTCQSAAFTDNSTNKFVITQYGNTTVTGNAPFQSGYYSNYFDGSGDYLTSSGGAASAMGSGDFSCEAFVYWTRYPTQYTSIFSTRSTNNANAAAFTVGVESSGYVYAFSSAFIAQTSSGVFALNTWNHVVFTRSGTTARLFVNGVLRATGTNTQNFTDQGFAVAANRDGTEPGAGYVSNVRLVKGSIPTDYQTSSTTVGATIFTPPTAPLTAISGTSLLTCQANRLLDSSTNNFTITKNGDVSVQSFDPFYTATVASNGGSMYFDGNGDYLSLAGSPAFSIAASTTPFTVEGWLYPTAAGGVIFNEAYTGPGTTISIAITMSTNANSMDPTGGRYVSFGAYNGSFWTTAAYSSSQIQLNTWTHVACVFTGSTTKIFFNGVDVTAGTPATTWPVTGVSGDGWYVGRRWDTYADVYFSGYISDFRFTNGTAVYTTAFTPPTAPLTPSGNTVLLLNGMNAGTYDAGMQNNLETTGNTQVSTGQAKFGTTSAYFDGSGVLSVPANTAFNFSTGDFTIECWLYPTATATVYLVGQAASNDYAPVLLYLTSGRPGIAVSPSNGTWTINNYVASALTLNTWSHVAAVRYGNKWSIYVNGVENVIAASTAVTPYVSTDPLGIGGEAVGGLNYPYYGYIDDLRITRGYARYTANFTPPTAALPIY